MSADARERKTFFFISHMRARTHSSCFFALTLGKNFIIIHQNQFQWYNYHSVNKNGLFSSMFFVCFIFFLSSVGSVCLAGLLSQQARQKRTRVLFFLKRAQVCDGVDTVIVFARIFGAHFFLFLSLLFSFLYFCLLFFGETFGHRASAFLSFLIINMGGPEKKKHNSFSEHNFFC